MARARLAAAGLLLLALPTSALRALGRGAQLQGAGGVPDAEDEALERQSKMKKTRTLRSFKDNVKSRLLNIPGIETVNMVSTGVVANTTECSMSQSSCHLADLPRGVPIAIRPGGSTRCIFGEEFFFEVFPGDADKLLIHLDGGGACWDEMTTIEMPTCMPTPQFFKNMAGPFNTCPGDNPFQGYTAIFVPHCSGDLHAGSVKHPWENKMDPGSTVEQRGYDNVRAVLDWVKANMPSTLAHLAFTGESAGAIGAAIWSSTVLRELHYERATVLADSYVGIFPDRFQGPVFKSLGACDVGLLEGALLEKCRKSDITIPEIFEAAMQEFPNVIFGSLNSKHDQAQVMFYNVAIGSLRVMKAKEYCGDVDPDECDLMDAPADVMEDLPVMDTEQYHERIEQVIETYSQNPNYVSYLMSGNAHTVATATFGNCDFVNYDMVTPAGGWLGGRDGDQRASTQRWYRQFFDASAPKSSVCERFLLSEDDQDYCRDKQELKKTG